MNFSYKRFLIFLMAIWFIGCAGIAEDKNQNLSDTVRLEPQSVTKQAANLNSDTEPVISIADINNFNFIYLNKAFYLSETKDLYVSIGFKKGIEVDYEKVMGSADSIISKNDEYERRSLPINLAEQNFNLEPFEKTLTIFNGKGKRITSAEFIRVEFLDGLIAGQFIAVLKPKSLIEDESDYYALIGPKNNFSNVNTRQVSIDNFAKHIFKTESARRVVWSEKHVESNPSGSVYSILSVADANFKNTSLLFERNGATERELMKFSKDYILTGITIAPMDFNEKPVLLFDLAVPDTDMTWHQPAFYDGEKYALAEGNLIGL